MNSIVFFALILKFTQIRFSEPSKIPTRSKWSNCLLKK